jgi:sortase A
VPIPEAADGELGASAAGVRLVDEHERRVVELGSDTTLPTQLPERQRQLPAPRRRRARSAFALVLVLLGTLTLADAAVTFIWQEPISALYAKLRQDHLSSVLRREERTPPTPTQQRRLASLADEEARIAYLAGELQRHAAEGSAVGRIVIPRIGANFVVVNGTSAEALKSGPGVYPGTNFPGIAGTTAIAGHRTTYLAPFRHVDALSAGNLILLNMPYAHLTYKVLGLRIVPPSDVQAAVAKVGYSRLVLSACTPLFSASKRLLVYARLARVVPEGAARRLPAGGIARPIEALATPRAASTRRAPPAVLESLDPHVLSPLV